MKREWESSVMAHLETYGYPSSEIVVYGDGVGGNNEIAAMPMGAEKIIQKVMLSNKKYHQRRKALTEATNLWLDVLVPGRRVVPNLYVEMFEAGPGYKSFWGENNIVGAKRVCQVIRGFAGTMPGDEWRGEMYRKTGNLFVADSRCRDFIERNLDAEKISFIDFLTITQDRSARNWTTDGVRFFAIDNGMAWFHEYPENDLWKQGCVIDDVILQVNPFRFISGIFTTLYAGRPFSEELMTGIHAFDEKEFKAQIEYSASRLSFPHGISEDWRYEGLLRRLKWMKRMKRQPTADEFRSWHRGSDLMTPPEIIASGGKIIWSLEWDRNLHL